MRGIELYRAWRERHGAEWSELGIGPSAERYALVVADHRCGERSSLSCDVLLTNGRSKDRDNRKQIRAEVDAIRKELAND